MRCRWAIAWLLGICAACQGLAQEFMGEDTALRQAYPEADRFVPLQVAATTEQMRAVLQRARSSARAKPGQTWVATQNGALVGTAYTDHVIGRTEYITWLCALGGDGRVRRLQVLAYREAIGGEIVERRWLDEFVGIGPEDELRRGCPVSVIAGATMSVDALTERTRFLLDWHAVVVAPLLAQQYPVSAPAPATTVATVPVGNSAFTVTLSPAGPGDAALVVAATAAATRWNQVLNQWEDSSELAAVNRAGGGVVSTELGTVLSACRDWHAVTSGRFDPTVGPLISALASGRTPPMGVVGWNRIAWDAGRVTLPVGGTLDLGAVAKGWILDAAKAAVAPALAPGQSLHLDYGSSSQLAAGASGHALRLVHPGEPARTCQELTLAPGQAFGAANAAGRTFSEAGARRSHLIDPLTGLSADVRRAAYVVAPTAALADALDTALCILPISEALQCARAAGAEALLWDGAAFHATPGWPGRGLP
jgi:thiamine biosynthesis lipoprotein